MTSQEDQSLVLPSSSVLSSARSSLHVHIPKAGFGISTVEKHLNDDISPALNANSSSPNYYGFVTGGATTAATLADNIVTKYDQNVQVHLPQETVATDVEDAALCMLCELVEFKPEDWPHRTFTTGATASNVLGLACGREFVIREAAKRKEVEVSVSEDGLLEAMRATGIEKLQVLTTVPHSSLGKAASIVGLGRRAVIDVSQMNAPHRFDLDALEAALSSQGTASIVVISAAEVNTGNFATTGEEMAQIRKLCDKHGAWIHIDAAFGLLARVLSNKSEEYRTLLSHVQGLELADSITSDAHKLVNVPYDCGIFLSRHLNLGIRVFQNANAAYLASTSSGDTPFIPSPLNIGIENSRRFRALPVYATLAAYGLEGYRSMLERQIGLSRKIARYIAETPGWELLGDSDGDGGLSQDGEEVSLEQRIERIFIIVIFRASSSELNSKLVARINGTRRIYVSGTQWQGKPAARFAVANWQVDVERDFARIKGVLEEVQGTS